MASIPCVGCGNSTPPSRGTKPRKWCTETCRVRSYGVVRVRRVSAVSFPTCPGCGEVFAARKGGRGRPRVACSPSCLRLWKNVVQARYHASRSPEQAQAKLARKMIRRALEAGVESERFTPLEIFVRDNWICGLCAEPVEPVLKHPDPMCASIDHVVPVKLGGTHTRANVQCVHLVCNLRKGARAAEQVA